MNKNYGKEKSKPIVSGVLNTIMIDNSSEDEVKGKHWAIFVALLLAVVTIVAYSNVLRNEFVYFDDDVYVFSNIHVQHGLSWKGLYWALTTTYANNWHPLTWLSHMLDVQLFGLNPAGHHFTNLFLHILATLFLFGFMQHATRKLWISAFVAALFALHPLHVESVAWVAERKDILSAVFWFATMWAYVYYARRPGFIRYTKVFILFALGLMSKPMLVTLPIILLLLDYWPLERLLLNRRSFERLVSEKLPLLVIAVASSIITIIAQQAAIGGLNRINLPIRIANAILSYCVYIGQAFWPIDLSAFYPYVVHPLPIKVVVGALFLVTITSMVVWQGRRMKYLVTGWFWYIVTLVPVIGIIQVGSQAHADRYTYLPFVGIFIVLSWGLNTILNRLQSSKKLIILVGSIIVLGVMAFSTWERVKYWKNDFTLFSNAIAVTHKNYIAYNNLGYFFERTGRKKDALTNYQKALEFNSTYGDSHYNLGNMLLETGRIDEAIDHYLKALKRNPDKINILSNLAGAYVQKGQLTDAVPLMQKALALAKAADDETQIKDISGNLELLNQEIISSKKP